VVVAAVAKGDAGAVIVAVRIVIAWGGGIDRGGIIVGRRVVIAAVDGWIIGRWRIIRGAKEPKREAKPPVIMIVVPVSVVTVPTVIAVAVPAMTIAAAMTASGRGDRYEEGCEKDGCG